MEILFITETNCHTRSRSKFFRYKIEVYEINEYNKRGSIDGEVHVLVE